MKIKGVLLGFLLVLLVFTPVHAIFIDPTISFENMSEVPVIVYMKTPMSDSINIQKEHVSESRREVLSHLKTVSAGKRVRVISIHTIDFTLGRNYSVIPAFSGNVTPTGLEKLKKDPQVDAIYFDHVLSLEPIPGDSRPGTELSYGSPAIGAPYVWDSLNFTGRNITISIVDTGIDYTHSAFGNCVFIGEDCRIKGGYDFYNNDANPMDDHGHGTHVAGIAAGDDATYRGVAYEADLLAVKVLNWAGSGYWSDVIAGIDYSVSNGADVISMSLGGNPYFSSPYALMGTSAVSRAVDDAVDLGAVVVVAAGNSGPGTSTIGSPGDNVKGLTVGSSYDHNTVSVTDDTISVFSSRGPSAFGRLDPDLVAPGQSICSARASGTTLGSLSCGDSTFVSASGTSMATPHVAGAAALLLESNSSLSPFEVRARLMQTSTDLGEYEYDMGSGAINVSRAIAFNSYALINGDDRWEVFGDRGKNYSTTLTIINNGNVSLNFSWSLSSFYNTKARYSFPASLNLDSNIIINAHNETSMNVTLSIPGYVNGSTYFSTLVLSSNVSESLRVPIVVTVPVRNNIENAGYTNVDIYSSSESYGDWLFFKLNNPLYQNVTVILDWDSSVNDLDLFFYNSTGARLTYSAQGSTSNESLVISNLLTPIHWALVNTYSIIPSTLSFNITFITNFAPEIIPIPDLSVNESEVANITVVAEDFDSCCLVYGINDTRFSREGNNTFSWATNFSSAGSYALRVNVSDGSRVSTDDFVLTIINVNRAPNITGFVPNTSNFGLAEPENVTFNITYIDADTDPVFVMWMLNGAMVASGDTFTLIGNYSTQRTNNLTAILNDSTDTVSVYWNVTINNTNRIPSIINATPSVLSVEITEPENLTFWVDYYDQDIDDTPVALWYVNGTLVLNSTNTFTLRGNYSLDRSYNVTCIIDDQFILNQPNVITWLVSTIDSNGVPWFLYMSNVTVNESDIATIVVNATDPDPDILSYSFGYPFNETGYWQTSLGEEGVYKVFVGINDSEYSVNTTIVVSVLNIDTDNDGNPDSNETDADGDGINNENDRVLGNASNMITPLSNVTLLINESLNLSRQFTRVENVSLRQNGKNLVFFSYDFNRSTLDVPGIRLVSNRSNNRSFMLVKGVENVSKTLYLNISSNNSDSVCVKDALISFVTEFSPDCSGISETLLRCDGVVREGKSCTARNGSFEIVGLLHSGVLESNAPPSVVGYTPNGTISEGSATLAVVTDENASCRYDSHSGTSFGGMNGSFSGTTIHSTTLSGLTEGAKHYYVLCNDSLLVSNEFDASFIVDFPSVATSSSGGGGGGGGISLPTPDIVTKTWVSLLGGSEKSMDVDLDVPVTRIDFIALDDSEEITLSVREVESLPSNVKGLENVYSYLSIGLSPSTQIESATIYFSVDKDWLKSYNLTPDEIVLMHFDKSWEILETNHVGSTVDSYTFEAESDSFSYFAISFMRNEPALVVPEIEQPANVESVEEVETEEVIIENPINQEVIEEPETSSLFMVVISFILVVMVLGSVVWFAFRPKPDALHDYVQKELECGVHRVVVIEKLVKAGWEHKAAREAVQCVLEKKSTKNSEKSRKVE